MKNENTGYKLATRILLRKTVDGAVSEQIYYLGHYAGDRFMVLSPNELAALSTEAYNACVKDTKLYIMTREEVPDLDRVFDNLAVVEDQIMCPLPLRVNTVSVNARIVGEEIIVTYTASANVASDVTVGLESGGRNIIKLGKAQASAAVPAELHGKTVKTILYVGTESVCFDKEFEYRIDPLVEIPKVPVALKQNKIEVSFDIRQNQIRAFVNPYFLTASVVITRFTKRSGGAVSSFDVKLLPGTASEDGENNGSGVGVVPENFYGQDVEVSLYSVDGQVGADRDAEFYYTLLTSTLRIPDLVEREKNMIDVVACFDAGEICYRATSEKSVASDVLIGFDGEDQQFILPYITIGKHTNTVTGNANTLQYGKDFMAKVYGVNHIQGVSSDSQYTYVATGRVIHIPTPLDLPDNTPVIDFIIRDGKVFLLVNLPYPADNELFIGFKGLIDLPDTRLMPGESYKEWELPVSACGKPCWPVMLEVGGSLQQYSNYFWGSRYRYAAAGVHKVIPTLPRTDNFITVTASATNGEVTLMYVADKPVASQIFVRATDPLSRRESTGNFSENTRVAYDTLNDYNNALRGKTVNVTVYRVFASDGSYDKDYDAIYNYRVKTPTLVVPE